VITDLILSPAVPSVTARCGGIMFPIVRGLASSLGSEPNTEASSKIIGAYLVAVSFQTTV
jgi:divalent anion:Na+ symporter, DASS family